MNIKWLIISLLVLVAAKTASALPGPLPSLDLSSGPVAYESNMIQDSSGNTITVDWIVMKKSDLVDLSGQTLLFGTNGGSLSEFADSEYYYFYQVENTATAVENHFQIDVEAAFIDTMGILSNANLDTLFNHNPATYTALNGEKETATGTYDPNFFGFTMTGTPAHLDWYFLFTGHLSQNEQSTVFFISSDYAPIYNKSSVIGQSDSYDGYVPTPPLQTQITIPEPVTLTMVGISITALLRRKRA